MLAKNNPYSLGPTANQRLLENRRGEIGMVLDALGGHDAPGRHALVLGDARSGRTSVLQEVARRLRAAGDTLVVDLRMTEDEIGVTGLIRGLFGATAEALLVEGSDPPAWYQAWCDRLYLRDRSPMSAGDLLVSALAFAADTTAVLDPAVIIRDLKAFARLAAEKGVRRIVAIADDADALLEDTDLAESLIDALEDAGHWHLVMASRFSGAAHLAEAASPVLRRVDLVPLRGLWLPNKIKACFTAPLNSEEADRLLPKAPGAFLLDVLRLTSGNPFEIALVGYHLWMACWLGEQEHYELTPKVLDRFLSDISRYTGAPPEVRAGAQAVRELPPERMRVALDLVALSELTTRQVAIARMLGLPNGDLSVNTRLLTCDLDAEEQKVVGELKELEDKGVVTLGDDGRFTVQGGRQAAVALKYHARSFAGSDAERPFGIPYIACVGDPLTELCTHRAGEALSGARRLAAGKMLSPTPYASAARIRAALEAVPFTGVELPMMALDEDGFKMIADITSGTTEVTVGVVNFTVSADNDDLNLVDVWLVPDELDSHELNQVLSDVVDQCRPLVEAAELTWNGARHVLFRGEAARDALILLCPPAAEFGLRDCYGEWAAGTRHRDPSGPAALAGHIVDVLRSQRPADLWALSEALSRHGFMLSLCEGRLKEALCALEEAIERGPADGWVTTWNIVNVNAQQGNYGAALEVLEGIAEPMTRHSTVAVASLFVPNRPVIETLIEITPANASAIHALQAAVFRQLAGADGRDDLDDAMADCAESDVDGMKVAKWVLDAFGSALGVSSGPPAAPARKP